MIEKRKNYRMISMLAALFVGAMFLVSGAAVLAQMDEYEPNDDFLTATPVNAGYTYNGHADYDTDPSDFYQIYLISGDVLTVTMLTSQLDMDLYDPSQNWVDDSYSNDLGQPHIEYTAQTSGYHYVEVNCYSPDVDYTIEFLVNDQSSGGTSSGDLYVGGDNYVSGDPIAELPELTVGDGVYWGGIKDIGEEYKQEIEEGLQEIEAYGFDADIDVSGGGGAYFGLEVVSDDTDINGATCYDIAITGAVAIDVGIKGSIDGTVTDPYMGTITVDGSGSGYFVFEANLDGHLYLTVDELAIAKLELVLTAEGHGEVHVDADMSMSGTSQSIKADAEMDIENVMIDFDLAFDPPLDIYQFGTGNGGQGIYEGKEWYVPGHDTTVSGSLNAMGTISYDVNAVVPGEEPVDESETKDLATEIGTNDFSTDIPGGMPDWGWDGGTLFTCVKASGNKFIIETDAGNMFGNMDMPLTRQFDMMDPTSAMPATGMQYDGEKGMITGMSMDGEVMTQETTSDEVNDFSDDPLSEVKSETGGHGSGLDAGLLGVILIGVIVVVVVILVVVMLTKKKPPQQYPPQQYQQQPPPPPPEYQPPQQQQQYQPPPDQQNPPPPPPPPTQ